MLDRSFENCNFWKCFYVVTFHFIRNSQIACDPLFEIRMRTFANRMRTFAMRFWPVRNVWFLANVRMRTIVSDWRQPIRKQLYETKRQRRHVLSKGDRFHWLNKQSNFVRISFKCVLNSHAFGIRNSQIAFVLRIAIEVEMGLKGVPTEASSKGEWLYSKCCSSCFWQST